MRVKTDMPVRSLATRNAVLKAKEPATISRIPLREWFELSLVVSVYGFSPRKIAVFSDAIFLFVAVAVNPLEERALTMTIIIFDPTLIKIDN